MERLGLRGPSGGGGGLLLAHIGGLGMSARSSCRFGLDLGFHRVSS